MYFPFIVAALLFGCLIPDLPYGYFQFLRWAVFLCVGYGSLLAKEDEQHGWLVPFIGVAILFNPIAPISMA